VRGGRGVWVGLTYSSSSSPSSQVSMRLPSGSLLQGQYSLPFDLLICHHYIPPSGGFWACLWGVWVCTSWAYLSGVSLWRLSGVCVLGVSLWGVSMACLWACLACLWAYLLGVGLRHTLWVALWGVLWVGWSYLLGILSPASGVVTLRGGLVWAGLSEAPHLLGWWYGVVGVGLETS